MCLAYHLPSRLPYLFGMYYTQYWQQTCCLCHLHVSTPHINRHGVNGNLYQNRHKNGVLSQKILQFLDKGVLCKGCQQAFSPIPNPFTVQLTHPNIPKSASLSVQSAYFYQYPLSNIIRRFKLKQDMTLLPVLVYLLRQLPRPHGCHATNSIILPMPTTKERVGVRGFDPVSILVAYLSKHWGIPVWQGVKRVDHTEHQRGLSRAERLQNLENAFLLVKPVPVSRVILFDDVVTTGASMSTLATTVLLTDHKLKVVAYCVAHV